MTGDGQRAQVAAAMTEDDLLRNTVALAQTLQWLTHHCRPAWTEKGWRTPVQGNRGFPDLVLARGGVVLMVELKRERERLTTAQQAWQAALVVPGSAVGYAVWRPSDLLNGTIRGVLERGGTQPAGVTPGGAGRA